MSRATANVLLPRRPVRPAARKLHTIMPARGPAWPLTKGRLMAVRMRRLGTTGLQVGPLAFGGNVFGWTADKDTSFRLLDAFVGAGFNLIDTADVYSRWAPGSVGGESETILGRWLRRSGQRAKVILATKVGLEMGPADKGLSRRNLLPAAERSLQRF